MGVKVAVVCEDPTLDRYIVRPIITRALAELGKPRATIKLVENPKMRGVQDVLSQACDVLDRYGGISSAVVFVVDMDCEDGEEGRPDKRARLRNVIERCQRHSDKAIALIAVQEVEVWALWGIRASLGSPWQTVRAECHPKEMYFEPQITSADQLTPDGGRTRLIDASLAGGWQSVTTGCPELRALLDELRPLVT
jgi:hypothetical protein